MEPRIEGYAQIKKKPILIIVMQKCKQSVGCNIVAIANQNILM